MGLVGIVFWKGFSSTRFGWENFMRPAIFRREAETRRILIRIPGNRRVLQHLKLRFQFTHDHMFGRDPVNLLGEDGSCQAPLSTV